MLASLVWSSMRVAPRSLTSAARVSRTMSAGVAAWLVFTLWLHGLLIGVRPLG